MAARFVADEFDLDLPALTVAFLIIIIVIIRRCALTLHAARLRGGCAILSIVELVGRGLVVLIGKVGHDEIGRV